VLQQVRQAQQAAADSTWVGFSAMSKLEALGYTQLTADEDRELREIAKSGEHFV
jgi:hypothetical protein